jgi:hydrogenase maturation protease
VSTLVLGVGNTLRGDDGVAARVLELLALHPSKELHLRPALSLVPELAVDIARHGRVIFVDADVRAENVTLERLSDEERDGLHRLAPTSLVAYARSLGFTGEAWVCRLPVESMEAGVALSARAAAAAQEAANLLLGAASGARGKLRRER